MKPMILNLLLGFLTGIVLTFFYEFAVDYVHKLFKKKRLAEPFGLIYHHSLFGILFILIYFFTFNYFILGFGIGIIVRHTWEEKRFVFIEKI